MNKIEKARITKEIENTIYSILLQANKAIILDTDDESLKNMVSYLHSVDTIMSRKCK